MSRSLAILNALVDTRNTVAEIQSTDEVGAVLTLTRTAVQSITTAGTTLVWQSEIRGYQITWSGSNITMPASGWYHISVAILTSAALNELLYRLGVNGVNVQFVSGVGDVDRGASSATFMRYFAEGDVVQISLLPSANVNVNVVAESGNFESPILNIVQLSGDVDTEDAPDDV
jgi:hypothetical protein